MTGHYGEEATDAEVAGSAVGSAAADGGSRGRDDETAKARCKRGASRSKGVHAGAASKNAHVSGGSGCGDSQHKRSGMVSKAANSDSRGRRAQPSCGSAEELQDGTRRHTKGGMSPSERGGYCTVYSDEMEMGDGEERHPSEDAKSCAPVCDPLLQKVLSELLRMRRTVAQIPECVHQEVKRCEASAALRQAQANFKDAEEEVRRANEAACGARCEENGHIKAAEKARVDQQVQRTKMLELVAEVEDLGGEDESAMLRRIEAMIKKGDEARSALAVLDHIPALTKATTEHKVYEDNLHRVKQRGDAGAALMDGFQGFAEQAARSDKARAEASARAMRAEKEHARLQERLVQVEQTVAHYREKSNKCAAPMPRLAEWILAQRALGGAAVDPSKMLQERICRRLQPTVSEWRERSTSMREQLACLREKEQEDKSKQDEMSERASTLLLERCQALRCAREALLFGSGDKKSEGGGCGSQAGGVAADGAGAAGASAVLDLAANTVGEGDRIDVKEDAEDGLSSEVEGGDIDNVLAELKQAGCVFGCACVRVRACVALACVAPATALRCCIGKVRGERQGTECGACLLLSSCISSPPECHRHLGGIVAFRIQLMPRPCWPAPCAGDGVDTRCRERDQGAQGSSAVKEGESRIQNAVGQDAE